MPVCGLQTDGELDPIDYVGFDTQTTKDGVLARLHNIGMGLSCAPAHSIAHRPAHLRTCAPPCAPARSSLCRCAPTWSMGQAGVCVCVPHARRPARARRWLLIGVTLMLMSSTLARLSASSRVDLIGPSA